MPFPSSGGPLFRNLARFSFASSRLFFEGARPNLAKPSSLWCLRCGAQGHPDPKSRRQALRKGESAPPSRHSFSPWGPGVQHPGPFLWESLIPRGSEAVCSIQLPEVWVSSAPSGTSSGARGRVRARWLLRCFGGLQSSPPRRPLHHTACAQSLRKPSASTPAPRATCHPVHSLKCSTEAPNFCFLPFKDQCFDLLRLLS